MSTRRPLNPFNPGSHPAKSETSRIAGFYSEDMSKEAVGKLFRSYGDDDLPEGDPAADDSVGSEQDGYDDEQDGLDRDDADLIDASGSDGMEDSDDSDYTDYINSYSKAGKPGSRRITRQERVLLNEVGPRKIQETDGSRPYRAERPSGGEIRRAASFETDKHDSIKDYENTSIFRTLASNSRYVALFGVILALVVITFLIIQTNSLNAELVTANATIDTDAKKVADADKALAEAAGKDEQIADLQEQIDDLTAQLGSVTQNDPAAPESSDAPETTGGEPESSEPPTAEDDTYIVQAGDNLYNIMMAHYGEYDTVMEARIVEVNTLPDASSLSEGQKLILPKS